MRPITLRYSGDCRKCAATLEAGVQAVYEKRVGIFCPPCAPTDPEEIRTYRQEAADRRADRYEAWAEKREHRAGAVLNSHKEIRSDIAFNTQPGHIPFRARLIAADDRAYESLNKAQRFREKADRLRKVRIAGDAERRNEACRESVRAWIKPGMLVMTAFYGSGTVQRVNKKTATITNTGQSRTFTTRVDLMFIRPIKEVAHV